MPNNPRIKTQIVRRAYFSAAHLPYPGRSGVGHNYVLDTFVEGSVDPQSGMVMPLHDLDVAVQEVVSTLDHRFLDRDLPYFQDTSPTLENIAHYCFAFLHEILIKKAPDLVLAKIRLLETDDLWVDVIRA